MKNDLKEPESKFGDLIVFALYFLNWKVLGVILSLGWHREENNKIGGYFAAEAIQIIRGRTCLSLAGCITVTLINNRPRENGRPPKKPNQRNYFNKLVKLSLARVTRVVLSESPREKSQNKVKFPGLLALKLSC